MKIQTHDIFYLDTKPAEGIIVELGQKSFRAYFPGVNEEEAEVLEFERRTEIDPDELNVIVTRTYHAELSGSTVPEDGEFELNGNRALFALVRVFRVVPFHA